MTCGGTVVGVPVAVGAASCTGASVGATVGTSAVFIGVCVQPRISTIRPNTTNGKIKLIFFMVSHWIVCPI